MYEIKAGCNDNAGPSPCPCIGECSKYKIAEQSSDQNIAIIKGRYCGSGSVLQGLYNKILAKPPKDTETKK